MCPAHTQLIREAAEAAPVLPADDLAPSDDVSRERARPIPRISIQAFCESPPVLQAIESAADDRQLAKTHVGVHMAGALAAVHHYEDSPTPNLIIIESALPRQSLLRELDRLADCCDPGTKVIVIGHLNDVVLYRELLKRGVSEYLVAPVSAAQVMESLSNLYNNPASDPVGYVHAFIGAKGGVGSSTICHNVAWIMSEALKTNVIINDFDLAFGTAGLNFNQDPVQGIADVIATPDRLDEVLLDRLLTKCSEYLSIFAAPVALDRDYDITPSSCEAIIDIARQNVPFVVLDLPHHWAPWSRQLLMQADEVVITAELDLANLRNAKNMVDILKSSRKNDAAPHLILNKANVPGRPEITVKEFEDAVGLKALGIIDFDPDIFGEAANNGRMLEELDVKADAVKVLKDVAMTLSGRKEEKTEKKSPLAPLLQRFKLKL